MSFIELNKVIAFETIREVLQSSPLRMAPNDVVAAVKEMKARLDVQGAADSAPPAGGETPRTSALINSFHSGQTVEEKALLALKVARTLEREAAALREAVQAAGRIMAGKYLPWSNAGGPNECAHGRADGIPCPECDLLTLKAALADGKGGA